MLFPPPSGNLLKPMSDFVSQIVEKLKPYNPQKIILFGSQVTGKTHEDSDYDIAIIKDTNKSFHDRLIDVRRLIFTTQPIDFFVFTPEEFEKHKNTNLFVKEIAETGKIVYEN